VIRKKLAADAIRDGSRFSEKIMPNPEPQSIQFEMIAL